MDQLKEPKVSICIPSYKGAAFIGATIESVLAQTLQDFELIIIDDGSQDNTINIIKRYSDPRVLFYKNNHNLGPERNWNLCLSKARGKYIKLLPQDDLIAPDCLAKQVAILENDGQGQIALVFCMRQIIDEKDRFILIRRPSKFTTGIIPAAKLIRQCIRGGTNVIGEPGSVLFRRKLADSIGKFDCSIPYVVDVDYWLRLMLKGDAYYLAEPLSSFRLSRGSWSVSIGTKQSTEYRQFIAKISSNSSYSMTRIDAITGKLMAQIYCLLRLAFYQFFLK